MVNAIILQTSAKIYVLWSTSINRKKWDFNSYGKKNKEPNALIRKNFQKYGKNQKKVNRGRVSAF